MRKALGFLSKSRKQCKPFSSQIVEIQGRQEGKTDQQYQGESRSFAPFKALRHGRDATPEASVPSNGAQRG